MNEDPKIIELLTDMLIEHRETNKRLEKLEEQQAKTNVAIGELRLSVMRLADKFETVAEHDKRIYRLEEAVFHAGASKNCHSERSEESSLL
ncbi:MAG: hypothetical protein HW421_3300 [Ignavibacteria bacterium]|nr:hypothetical protein [Ignavibacteria bacterium]